MFDMCMRRLFPATGLAICLILTSLPAQAALVTFICPTEIATKQTGVDTPPNWDTFSNRADLGITTISLYDAPPDQGHEPLNADSGHSHGDSYSMWNLAGKKAQFWMSCQYLDTTVTLTRKLPQGLKRCWYKNIPGPDHSDTLICQ